jgi:hypothetical protein
MILPKKKVPVKAYAATTKISVEQSKTELQYLLSRYGATHVGVFADEIGARAVVVFVINDRNYRLEIPMPSLAEVGGALSDKKSKQKKQPTDDKMFEWAKVQWDQACRARWRAVTLLVKAKLEMVRIHASTIEHEFLADMVLPGNVTVATIVERDLRAVLEGSSVRLLGEGK